MSEAELLMVIAEYESMIQVIFTWLFGANIGLYSVGYFAGKNLNARSVTFVVLMYFGFLSYISMYVTVLASPINGAIESLLQLESEGVELTALSEVQIDKFGGTQFSLGQSISVLFFLAIGIGAIVYLLSQYRLGETKRKKNVDTEDVDT